jgi:hypothetical protein
MSPFIYTFWPLIVPKIKIKLSISYFISLHFIFILLDFILPWLVLYFREIHVKWLKIEAITQVCTLKNMMDASQVSKQPTVSGALSLWLIGTLPTGRKEHFWKPIQRRQWVNVVIPFQLGRVSLYKIDLSAGQWVFFHLPFTSIQTPTTIIIFKAYRETKEPKRPREGGDRSERLAHEQHLVFDLCFVAFMLFLIAFTIISFVLALHIFTISIVYIMSG